MTTKINALGIGTTITVDDTRVTIIDRAPGGPGLMWATDNRGGYYKIRPATARTAAKVVEGPMTAGGKILPGGTRAE